MTFSRSRREVSPKPENGDRGKSDQNFELSSGRPTKKQILPPIRIFRGELQDLQTALVSLAKNHPKHLRQRTIYGEEYEIIGPITAPAGRDIIIKSGWMIDSGQPGTIRFVTAYPA